MTRTPPPAPVDIPYPLSAATDRAVAMLVRTGQLHPVEADAIRTLREGLTAPQTTIPQTTVPPSTAPQTATTPPSQPSAPAAPADDGTRLLVTGSHRWTDRDTIRAALIDALTTFTTPTSTPPVLVHGGAAAGTDRLAADVWDELSHTLPITLGPVEEHPAADHSTPRAHNHHLVALGATVCLTFAEHWTSTAGMCARMARDAGILVVDHGAPTGREDRTRPQVVPLPDGTRRVQAKPPRADLLTYPHLRGRPTTVLVRRTHDLDLARQLAGERWLEHSTAAADARDARCAVIQPRPLVRHRAGWWTTTTGRTVPHRGAVDEQNRVVVWCDDPADTHAAGPGIEFRP